MKVDERTILRPTLRPHLKLHPASLGSNWLLVMFVHALKTAIA